VIASYSALDKRVEMQSPSFATQACFRKKIEEAPPRKEKVVSYVTFILSDEGKISNIEPYEADEQSYHKIAIDIVSSCGIEFKPGEIGGEPVSSLVYFPVNFGK
jgi:hypothetical protein